MHGEFKTKSNRIYDNNEKDIMKSGCIRLLHVPTSHHHHHHYAGLFESTGHKNAFWSYSIGYVPKLKSNDHMIFVDEFSFIQTYHSNVACLSCGPHQPENRVHKCFSMGRYPVSNWFAVAQYGYSIRIGDRRHRCQHWLRFWLVSWRHQAITWTNVDLSSIGFCHLRPLSRE